jgi:hypothetical protein
MKLSKRMRQHLVGLKLSVLGLHQPLLLVSFRNLVILSLKSKVSDFPLIRSKSTHTPCHQSNALLKPIVNFFWLNLRIHSFASQSLKWFNSAGVIYRPIKSHLGFPTLLLPLLELVRSHRL